MCQKCLKSKMMLTMIRILILISHLLCKKQRKATHSLSLVIPSSLQPTAVLAANHDLAFHSVMRGCSAYIMQCSPFPNEMAECCLINTPQSKPGSFIFLRICSCLRGTSLAASCDAAISHRYVSDLHIHHCHRKGTTIISKAHILSVPRVPLLFLSYRGSSALSTPVSCVSKAPDSASYSLVLAG